MSNEARWEWRTFVGPFAVAKAEILAHATNTRCSEETYFVSDRRDINVKIRDGQLDVKRLIQTDDTGLQQWTPVFKRGFPLDSVLVADVWRLWRVPPPDQIGGPYSERELVRFARHTPRVSVMRVTKLRHGAELDGCQVEFVQLDVDGQALSSIGVEAPTQTAVNRLLRRVALDRLENTDYVTALQRLKTSAPA